MVGLQSMESPYEHLRPYIGEGRVMRPGYRRNYAQMAMGAGAAGAAAYSAIKKMFSKPSPSAANAGIVTTQNDFVATMTTKKRKSKKQLRRKRIKKKKWRKFKIRVRKAVKGPRFYERVNRSFSHSWISQSGYQGVAEIAFLGYRGKSAQVIGLGDPGAGMSPSLPLNPTVLQQRNAYLADGTGNPVQIYTAEMNHWAQHAERARDKFFMTSNGATNRELDTWWVKIRRAYLDITLTNVGTSSDIPVTDQMDPVLWPNSTSQGHTGRPIEYELYLVWPKKYRPDQGVLQRCFADHISYAQRVSERLNDADTNAKVVWPSDVSFTPYANYNVKRYFKVRKIGQGYLGQNASVRIQRWFKPRALLTRDKYEAEFTEYDFDTLGHKRGYTASILVMWRGTPLSGSTGNNLVPPSRLAFMYTRGYEVMYSGQQRRGESMFLKKQYPEAGHVEGGYSNLFP